jgi:hypothetical protein
MDRARACTSLHVACRLAHYGDRRTPYFGGESFGTPTRGLHLAIRPAENGRRREDDEHDGDADTDERRGQVRKHEREKGHRDQG